MSAVEVDGARQYAGSALLETIQTAGTAAPTSAREAASPSLSGRLSSQIPERCADICRPRLAKRHVMRRNGRHDTGLVR